MVCQSGTRAFNAQGQVVAMACDSWSCPDCGPLQAWRWARRVRFGIALLPDRQAYFWTLTLPPWITTTDVAYRELPHRFAMLRQSIHRALGEWDYAAFVEEHPHRHYIPHLHIISAQHSPYRLKDLAHHVGFGYQAKEVLINGGMAASYVSKYVSKQGRQMPRHFRRVRISRGWPRLPEPEYDIPVYPPFRAESLCEYLSRVATLCNLPLVVVRERWLDKGSTIL